MKKTFSFFLIAFLYLALSACSEQKVIKKETKSAENVSLEINHSDFTFMNWEIDFSHEQPVVGKITADGDPVEGVIVQVGKKLKLQTNEKGEFSVKINRNVLEDKTFHVIDVKEAKVKGRLLSENTKKSLLSLEKEVVVHYPIVIDKVEVNAKDNTLVDVSGHAVLNRDKNYPTFTVDKYKVGGTVKDADGNPLKGAVVNLRRDGVEGFSMSEPSNEKGEFTMYYLPDDEENHYFFVHYGRTDYTLPPRKVYVFPDEISVNIDITLPKEGTIIDDKPPTLVTTQAKGALYKGTLIGVNVDVPYTISIPNAKGEFVLTLPKKEWENNPTFFETRYNEFLLEPKKSGDTISSDFITKPKENEPRMIVPTK
jgi:hypothetical protein